MGCTSITMLQCPSKSTRSRIALLSSYADYPQLLCTRDLQPRVTKFVEAYAHIRTLPRAASRSGQASRRCGTHRRRMSGRRAMNAEYWLRRWMGARLRQQTLFEERFESYDPSMLRTKIQ